MPKEDKAKALKDSAEEQPRTWKRFIPLLVGVVLIAGAIGGYFFWSSRQAVQTAPETAPARPTLVFYALDPPFVANFEGLQSFRFLQVHVRVAAKSQGAVDLMESIDPILRNDLLMLFSAQNAERLSTREGKEALRREALELVRKAVKTAGGDPALIDNVLFTSFVMQ